MLAQAVKKPLAHGLTGPTVMTGSASGRSRNASRQSCSCRWQKLQCVSSLFTCRTSV